MLAIDWSVFCIRSATAFDNVLLAECGAQTFFDTFAADNTPDDMRAYLANAFSPEIQARELAEPTSKFLIAENDQTVLGYARLKFAPAPPCVIGDAPMEIARFYARKESIGQGVGERMMQACLDQAMQAHCDVVWLDVWERNPRAIAFYRKWGFAQVGEQTFQLGDDAQHDWIMARAITRQA